MANKDYQKICELLEEKVNEVYLEMQEELNIQYGDITPLDALYQDKLIGNLAEHIENVLTWQQDLKTDK